MNEQKVIGRFEPVPERQGRQAFDVITKVDAPDWQDGDKCCEGIKSDGTNYHVILKHWRFDPTTPTLESMLTEWRDLTARAQAAQAEADALFEHAGQCHGEICVRLAELGWGAPRVAVVASEVVLPDMSDWKNWEVGDLIRVLDNEDHPEDFSVGGIYPVILNGRAGSSCDVQLAHSSKIWLYRESMEWVSRPSTQQ